MTLGRLVLMGIAGVAAVAQPATDLSADDRAAIQELMTKYAQALSGCKAAEFADLFVSGAGAFASGFRGRMVGREHLIALVESERQCSSPMGKAVAPRPNGPPVEIEVTPAGVRGLAKIGASEYQDEYVKTPRGWRFVSRSVILVAEKAAGLNANGLLAIQRLGGANLGDHYEADANGVQRLMTSGIKVDVKGGQVLGRAYLKDGSYDDQVYEKTSAGEWRVKSSTHIPAETH